ncbi:MAG: guanylate kinase [Lachnospiraceae bacterium]|nr:guanylate kinase [Lachnospiraceae bacterium]
MKTRGSLIVLSGFAGVGKGTVLKSLFETQEGYAYSVSATTRQPRPGEVDGVHYFFVSKERFEEMIRDDELLEHASYVGNYYGTPRAYVEQKLEEGFDVILEIEVQGALKIKEKVPEAVLIYMLPPSADILYERLKGRGTETDEVIGRRMKKAAQEAESVEQYDYMVVNDDADECAARLHALIRSQRQRVRSSLPFIRKLAKELANMSEKER